MGISGVGATTLSSFPQINREVHSVGMQATKERSDQAASYSKVSQFGTETKLGSSEFQRGNDTVISIGERETIKFPISVQTRR